MRLHLFLGSVLSFAAAFQNGFFVSSRPNFKTENMTGKKTVLLCGVVALLLCSASCSKDDGLRNTLSQQTRDNGCKEEMLVLGKEIVDPYCLTVMQKAFETMNQAKAPISKITPNHKKGGGK